jgi:hypothetical protein
MLRTLAVGLLALGSAGCDSAGPVDFEELSHDPAGLVGTWDLDRQWSYWSGTRAETIPGDDDYTETWTFSADGQAVHVVDTDVHDSTEEGPYGVVAEPGRAPVLTFSGGTYLFGLDGGRLILMDHQVGDAAEQVYERRR